jgi:hypothetical protein
MMGGFVLGLVVAIADIYFLMKRLMAIDQPKSSKKENFPRKLAATIEADTNLNKNVLEKKND